MLIWLLYLCKGWLWKMEGKFKINAVIYFFVFRSSNYCILGINRHRWIISCWVPIPSKISRHWTPKSMKRWRPSTPSRPTENFTSPSPKIHSSLYRSGSFLRWVAAAAVYNKYIYVGSCKWKLKHTGSFISCNST